jgi:heat shock protein HslJ
MAALLLAGCGQNDGGEKSGGDVAGYEWKLTEINGISPIAGRDVTLKLEDGQAGGSSGCNSYGGAVTLDGTKISFKDLFQTEMACMDPVGIMEQESVYLQTLSQTASYQTAGARLELKNAAGETTLVFSR